ncbi:MAG: sensor histidine kinase [Stackebrandtia sp.]
MATDPVHQRAWLSAAMHAGFFVLLAASAGRLMAIHEIDVVIAVILVMAGVMGLAYALGVGLERRLGRGARVWLVGVMALWLGLVLVAPSFGWCAVSLFFLCLRHFPPWAVVASAVVLTGAVVVGQLRYAEIVEPSIFLAPLGVAMMITAVFWALDRELVARQRLIDDLVATRSTLAETQRRAGVSAERERLAREIHDTLAQGLTSVGMLLQAAGRSWDGDATQAKSCVARAETVAADNLAEARRFVQDLRPARLTGQTLPEALEALCAEFEADHGLSVRFTREGDEHPAPETVQSALLRVAQSALSNVVEHSGADAAAVTLSYLDDEICLDVFDDGVGFARPTPQPGRGYGLPAMRERLAEVGGHLDVESSPGDGAAVAARVPNSKAQPPPGKETP